MFFFCVCEKRGRKRERERNKVIKSFLLLPTAVALTWTQKGSILRSINQQFPQKTDIIWFTLHKNRKRKKVENVTHLFASRAVVSWRCRWWSLTQKIRKDAGSCAEIVVFASAVLKTRIFQRFSISFQVQKKLFLSLMSWKHQKLTFLLDSMKKKLFFVLEVNFLRNLNFLRKKL